MKFFLNVLLLLFSGSLFAATSWMKTEFGEKVTAENAWRGYPRPQMVRENWTNLNGFWDYQVTQVTNTPGRPTEWAGRILVPFAPESSLSGVGRLIEKDEFLWYTRKINCSFNRGERVLLHFDGVDMRAQVFIGHKEVTDVPHEGGLAPFVLDITDFVDNGENELTVCVWDPTLGYIASAGKQTFQPNGCFYTRCSGIWQTVWIETVPAKHIRDYRITPDLAKSVVRLEFDVTDPGEKVEVAVDGVGNFSGDACKPLEIHVPNARLWTPETPNLYSFTAKYGKDVIKGYFAMRSFEKRKDENGVLRFFLNGEPRFVIGVLDQGWWPDGLLTPPSAEAMEFDIRTAKKCGFDMLRKHLKVEPLQFYALCDRIGMLVFQDMSSTSADWRSAFKTEANERYGMYRRELKDMIDLLRKSPSVVTWGPYNEGWSQPGEFLVHSTLDWVKRYDPTRLVNGPSGWQDFEGGTLFFKGQRDRLPSEHKPMGECEAGDIVDRHDYRGPSMHPVNDRRISFLGEFGGLGHPVRGHLWKFHGEASGDFSSGGNWGYGGIEDTKTAEGLEKTYLGLIGKLCELAEEGLAGSVYTQLTDVEIEINGLLTYDRKVLKFRPEVLKEAHDNVRARAMKGARKGNELGLRSKVSVLVVGDNEAACAAALQAARCGMGNVVLVSDCEMLGGQYSAQGVGPVDERVYVFGANLDFPRSGMALEIINAMGDYNLKRYGKAWPGNCWSATRTIEPLPAARIFERMLGEWGDQLRVYRGYRPIEVLKNGNRVVGVKFDKGLEVHAAITIDASDWGDVIRLGGVKHYSGVDPKSRFGEEDAPETVGELESQEMNPITWTMTLVEKPDAKPIEKPAGYDASNYYPGDIWREDGIFTEAYPHGYNAVPYNQRRLVDSRHFKLKNVTGDKIQLNATIMDYPLCQWPQTVADKLEKIRPGLSKLNFVELPYEAKLVVYEDAKLRSLGYLYFLQNDNPTTVERMRKFELSDEFGTPDRLPPKPYIREGLRLAAVKMLTANEVAVKKGQHPVWAQCPADAAFCFQFHLDFHPTRRLYRDPSRKPLVWVPLHAGVRNWSAQANRSFFPYSAFIPETTEGLLGAGKNVGVSSLVQSALRLHPQMVLSGQCAGALAAMVHITQKSPRQIVADAKLLARLQEMTVKPPHGRPGVAIWARHGLEPGMPGFYEENIPVVRPYPKHPSGFKYNPPAKK